MKADLSLVARLVVLALAASGGGCGWSYAGRLEQEAAPRKPEAAAPAAPRRAEPGGPAPVSRSAAPAAAPVEVVADARDLFTLGRNHRASETALTTPEMQRHAFRVRRVDGLNEATQLIHCTSGKTIAFESRPPSPAALAAAREAGVPLGEWVLEVDPAGTRPHLPSNDWYRHISKHHDLEFVGRNRVDGTVLYRYVGPRQGFAGGDP